MLVVEIVFGSALVALAVLLAIKQQVFYSVGVASQVFVGLLLWYINAVVDVAP